MKTANEAIVTTSAPSPLVSTSWWPRTPIASSREGDERPQAGHRDVPPVEARVDVHPVEELEQREGRSVHRQDRGEAERAERQIGTVAVELLDELTDERRHRLEASRLRPRAGEQSVCGRACGDGEQGRHAAEVVPKTLEEQARLGFAHDRVRERKDEVGKPEQLEARIRQPPAEPREHGRLRRPRDDERRPVEELRERNRSQGRAGGSSEGRELNLTPPGGNRDGAVDDGRHGKSDPTRVAVEEDEAREQRQRDVGAGVRAGDAVEALSVSAQLLHDPGTEVEQAESGRDDQHPRSRGLAFSEDEHGKLRHADGARGDE